MCWGFWLVWQCYGLISETYRGIPLKGGEWLKKWEGREFFYRSNNIYIICLHKQPVHQKIIITKAKYRHQSKIIYYTPAFIVTYFFLYLIARDLAVINILIYIYIYIMEQRGTDTNAMNINSTTSFNGEDFIDFNVDDHFHFEDDLPGILLGDNLNITQHSDEVDKKGSETNQKHRTSNSNIDLQEKRRRRNISEKLRTKKLNEEFTNLAKLFSTSSSLSKIKIIQTAQEVIKGLRRKLEQAEPEISKCSQSGNNKKKSLNNMKGKKKGPTIITSNSSTHSGTVENISEGFVFKHSSLPMSLLDISGVVLLVR